MATALIVNDRRDSNDPEILASAKARQEAWRIQARWFTVGHYALAILAAAAPLVSAVLGESTLGRVGIGMVGTVAAVLMAVLNLGARADRTWEAWRYIDHGVDLFGAGDLSAAGLANTKYEAERIIAAVRVEQRGQQGTPKTG
jgi:hypothetical protein